MSNSTVGQKTSERYSKEADNQNLGCAVLQQFFNIRMDDIVLDLGCGSGDQAISISQIVGSRGFIYGLDLTEKMIEKAKLKNNKTNVNFLQHDIHDLPFDDASVNVVLSNCVINHSLDKKKIFSEIYRVLKPGGHFLIGDVMAVEKLPDEVALNPDNIAECWGGAIPKNEYKKIISDIGFANISELSNRQYYKNNFLLESIIIKGEK
jgi:arsenite methyltransferase